MVYETLLLIGALGLGAQFAMGFGHGGHDNHSHGHGHGHGNGNGNGHAHGHAHDGHASAHGHAHSSVHAHGPAHGGHAHSDAHVHAEHSHSEHHHDNGKVTAGKAHTDGFSLLALLSPLSLFSISLGAGATGLLLRGFLHNPLLTGIAAAIGGIVFFALIVQPIKNFVLSFASKPAGTLTSVVAQEVEVISRFDERGRGLVRAEVDGATVSVLAHLEADDRKQGVVVTPGERLVVTQVDAEKNILRVTRL